MNKEKIQVIVLLSLCFFACSRKFNVKKDSVVGSYLYKTAGDYNYLILKADSSFSFSEKYHQPMDDVANSGTQTLSKGKFKVENNELILHFTRKFREWNKVNISPVSDVEFEERYNHAKFQRPKDFNEVRVIINIHYYDEPDYKTFQFKAEGFKRIYFEKQGFSNFMAPVYYMEKGKFPLTVKASLQSITGDFYEYGLLDKEFVIDQPKENVQIDIYPSKEFTVLPKAYYGKRHFLIKRSGGRLIVGNMEKTLEKIQEMPDNY